MVFCACAPSLRSKPPSIVEKKSCNRLKKFVVHGSIGIIDEHAYLICSLGLNCVDTARLQTDGGDFSLP